MTAVETAASNGQAPGREKPWQQLEEDQRRSDSTGMGAKVTVHGKVYVVHFGELSGLDARALRMATGYSTYGLWNQALGQSGAPDLDTAAAIVWLARYRAGETGLRYEDVLASVTLADQPFLDMADQVPEAPPEVRDETSGEAVSPPA